MAISISPVQPGDVDFLTRKVEYPAHLDGPLYRVMFPHSQKLRWEEEEDEIRWTADAILEAIHREDEVLYKACGDDGLPVGLIGWTTSAGASAEFIQGGRAVKPGVRKKRAGTAPPSTLDMNTLLAISKRLREERRRVLQSYYKNEMYRITFKTVNPNHQREGVGSTLMESFCRKVDESAADAFVMSSPAAVRLYSRFRFKTVGTVETEQGTFTSMFRASVLPWKRL
ncbi:hypothetical protein MGYG_04226 [Nannizzia gypsea CBS 118893]|uniref:N-acetyltransferase domain-containing protein n=1 Tax=Arthroderma gypseum (strain ATCC MYA-4604 / CBS 118893) TaxID=535722 RepID=E4URV0_ARTGP|nr:hypothetical protein MGYG_04226 [Nannizzia gypsea CBS 118893]EFR01222.1 hypothetical protein MGYG_04226 [Nannizzia gypsea CBS 118893]